VSFESLGLIKFVIKNWDKKYLAATRRAEIRREQKEGRMRQEQEEEEHDEQG